MSTTTPQDHTSAPSERGTGEVVRPDIAQWKSSPAAPASPVPEGPLEAPISLDARRFTRDIKRVMGRLTGQQSVLCALSETGEILGQIHPNLSEMRETAVHDLLKAKGLHEKAAHVVFVEVSRAGEATEHLIPKAAWQTPVAEHLATPAARAAAGVAGQKVQIPAPKSHMEKASLVAMGLVAAMCLFESVRAFSHAKDEKDPQTGQSAIRWSNVTYGAMQGILGAVFAAQAIGHLRR